MGHWLAILWDAMWPNIFAPSAITLVAIVVSHMLHRKAIATHMDNLRAHLAEQLHRHHAELKTQLAAHCSDIKEHVSAVAAGPVSVGAGSNPAGAGLAADGPVVPPTATTRRKRGM